MFTTPGTRLNWTTIGEWLEHLEQLRGRRIAAATYAARRAHLEELARRSNEWFQEQAVEDLERVVPALRNMRPVEGQRAGSSYERAIVQVKNAISNIRTAPARFAATIKEPHRG